MTKSFRTGQRRQLLSQFGGQRTHAVKSLLEVWIDLLTCLSTGRAAHGIFLNTTEDIDKVDHPFDPLRLDLDYSGALII